MTMKRLLRSIALCMALMLLLTTTGLAEILRPNSQGESVRLLQQALMQVGCYTGTIDGKYGPATEAAVRDFQAKFGLTVDGKAGSATQYQLKLLTGIEISSSATPGEGTGSTGGDSTGLFSGNYTKLVFGANSSRVRILQQALIDLGFEVSRVDGSFGTSTYKAVKAFQETVGLKVDGKAGPQTLQKLESYFDVAGNCVTGPIVTPPPAEDDENLEYGVPKRILRPGMSGLDVLYTQDRLKALGYYTGTCDGQYGDGTTAAVIAFQQKHALTADGKVGANTRRALFADDALSATQKPPAIPGDRVLREGMEGDDVLAVQKRLNVLGYYTKTLDGKYGSGTIAAVKAFQGRNGLKVDGICGADTIRVLYSEGAIDAGSTVTNMPDNVPMDKPTRILRSGMEGDDVAAVQYQLQLLDYYDGELDGKYGPETISAVRRFQARNGLKVDGKVGPLTADQLWADVAIPDDGSSATPTPEPTPSRTLRLGAKGDDVKLVQARLKELGYLTGSVDGVYGSGTFAAMTAFQLRNGLSADGVAGTKTYKKLFSDGAIAAESTSTNPPASSIPTRALYEGCTGDDVKQVQTRLKKLGYLSGKVDGKYGPATAAAMKAFQTKNGLSVTGMGETATYKVLFSDAAIGENDVPGSTVTYTTLRLGASGNAVIRLQQMLSSLKYTVLVNGYYDETTRAAVLAFQQRNGLEADGVAGQLTQEKLYSGSCVTGDTELPGGDTVIGGNGGGPSSTRSVKLLHWYDDLKGKLVNNRDTLLIYEPASNSSYYVRVYSCGQHCDAEPITKTDTATMKAAWGGKFAWTEKPVYVRLTNGTWCIASTHSMPHEENWIAGNDFDGHICIHFPRTMTECQLNAPENGVRHQNDIRKHWLKLTGETIPW